MIASTCDCGSGKIWQWGPHNSEWAFCEDCKPNCMTCGDTGKVRKRIDTSSMTHDTVMRPCSDCKAGEVVEQDMMLRKLEKWFDYPEGSQCAKEFYAETLRTMTAAMAAEHEGSGTVVEIAKAYTHSLIEEMCKRKSHED